MSVHGEASSAGFIPGSISNKRARAHHSDALRVAAIALRLSLAASFLSAVGDRLGFWGPPGSPNVAWGSWDAFVDYVALLNGFVPNSIIPALAYLATFAEVSLAVALVLGWRLRWTALASGVLLSTFALTMAIALGIKAPLDYSVLSAAAGSFLLAASSAATERGLRLTRAHPEDAPELRYHAVESFREDHSTYGAKPPGIEEVAFHAKKATEGHYYKVIYDGELVGAISVDPKTSNTAEIALFYIIPAYQNRGIGADILALIEAHYPQIQIWRLVTPSTKPRNRHFYERHGYRPVGETTPGGPGPTLSRYEKRMHEQLRAV